MVGDELTGFEECANRRVPAHRQFHGQRKEELPATVTPGKDAFFGPGFFRCTSFGQNSMEQRNSENVNNRAPSSTRWRK
jgi:hypothetical protein